MQEFASTPALRNEIINLLVESGMDDDCYTEMLDYTIDLFESQGLGADYYGYHNINHELEVTFGTLLASKLGGEHFKITKEDLKYLYTAALFHDFDPQKSVDKPHEESVLRFITMDKNLKQHVESAKLDIEIVKALILRTTYPWAGQLKENAEKQIQHCFRKSELTKTDKEKQEHYLKLGWFLSIVDRVSGYALGDFPKAMEMAKMNAHALAWHPSVIVRRSVAYFEELLNNETEMVNPVLQSFQIIAKKDKLVQVEDELSGIENVCAVYDVTGNTDTMIIAKFKGREDLSKFIKNLSAISNVESTITHVVLNTVKEDFRLI